MTSAIASWEAIGAQVHHSRPHRLEGVQDPWRQGRFFIAHHCSTSLFNCFLSSPVIPLVMTARS